MERSPQRNTTRPPVLAALGLFVLTLSAFAIVWPFNGSSTDEWYYLYSGQQGQWNVPNANRDYVFGETVLAYWLMPGRAQGIYILHVVCFWGVSLSIFHLLNRLNPGYGWFAFLTAAIYLVYIPFNGNQARPMYTGVYSWTALLLFLGITLLVEQVYHQGWWAWMMLLVGSLFGYAACRAYESTIPLLLAAPVLLFFATRRLSNRLVISACLWWAVVGVGVLQFAIPYLNRDASVVYQEETRPEKLVISTVWSATRKFFQNAFPVDHFLYVEYSYLLPAIILGLTFGVMSLLFRRTCPDDKSRFPSVTRLSILLAVGFVWVELGGSVYTLTVYLYRTERAHFFAAPGEALVIASVLGLAAWGMQRMLHIPAQWAGNGLAVGLFIVAAHWYYRADQAVYQDDSNLFDTQNQLFRDMVALAPNLTEKTALIYYCENPTKRYQFWRPSTLFAGSYLYAENQGIMFMAGQIHGLSLFYSANFDQDGVSLNTSTTFRSPQPRYRYDELVVLTCQEDGGLRIMDQFPPGLAPEGAALDTYDPYARIVQGFIPSERARILAR